MQTIIRTWWGKHSGGAKDAFVIFLRILRKRASIFTRLNEKKSGYWNHNEGALSSRVAEWIRPLSGRNVKTRTHKQERSEFPLYSMNPSITVKKTGTHAINWLRACPIWESTILVQKRPKKGHCSHAYKKKRIIVLAYAFLFFPAPVFFFSMVLYRVIFCWWLRASFDNYFFPLLFPLPPLAFIFFFVNPLLIRGFTGPSGSWRSSWANDF